MDLGRLALRTTVGGLFLGHGCQKLFGWFDGHGLDATAEMFGSLGMRPAKAHAAAAGLAEAGGGAAFVLGAANPLTAGALVATMVTAIRKVHGSKGPWVTAGGYEYNLVLIAAALAAVSDEDGAAGQMLLTLLLGVAGSFGADAVSARFAEPETPAEAPAPTDAAVSA